MLAVDIVGAFLFGIEGADAAIRGNLDVLWLDGSGVLDRARPRRGSRSADWCRAVGSATGATPPRHWLPRSSRFSFYRYVEAFPGSVMMLLDAPASRFSQ